MENLNGFIKIHRKLLKWEWYSDLNVRVLFFHCLLKANHKAERWQGIGINAGQFVTSYGHLAKECGLTTQQTRTALNKLKSTGEITNETTSRYSIITIKNWNLYQANNKPNNKQITNEQQTNNNKQEYKEDKEVKNINLSLINVERLGKREREILKSFCRKNGVKNPEAYIKTLIKNGDAEEIITEELRKQALKERKQSVDLVEVVNPEETKAAHDKFAAKLKQFRRIK